MRRNPVSAILLGALALAGALLVSCVDDRIVYRDRQLYDDPPKGAAEFLGYSVTDTKTTTCGNCHIGHQKDWVKTAHAHAWDTLQKSASAAATCENCHTVNEQGNATEGNAGWAATKDARYHDVQCESCHGPGLQHVQNPDATKPLASVLVATNSTSGCGECHSGAHNAFVEEWSQSAHGIGHASPQGNASCVSCHEAKGVFAAWGINDNYLEKTSTTPIQITCVVCHDPHNKANPKQLRYPIDVPDVEQNLCMKCHHRRATPDFASASSGPHSPQGPLLLGEDVGWRPPNFAYADTRIAGTHGSSANPRLCATCHVNRTDYTDPITGKLTFSATGHLFNPIPCLDAQGKPTPLKTSCPVEQRSFKACTASGCHGTELAARSAYLVAQTRIADLVTQLNALLARVPASQFNNNDGVYTTAEGAKFNAGLGAITSSAVHNPFLTEALLTASIKQVKSDYALTVPAAISLEPVLQRPVGVH